VKGEKFVRRTGPKGRGEEIRRVRGERGW